MDINHCSFKVPESNKELASGEQMQNVFAI